MDRPTRDEHEKILRVLVPKLENIAYCYVFFSVVFGMKIFVNSLLTQGIQIGIFDIMFIMLGIVMGSKYFSSIADIKRGDYLVDRGLCDKTLSNNKRAIFTDFKTGHTGKYVLCTSKKEKNSKHLSGRESLLYRAIPGIRGHYFVVIKD